MQPLAMPWLCGVLILSVCGLTCQAQPKDSAEHTDRGAMKFRSIKKVIARWSVDQQVYVQGDIGVGKTQLAELREWLAQNGPHWTVVLMESAEGQTFTAADGRRYSGMDAVEYALGYGLNNRTDFGKLVHPVTHEADGTVFALFLKERKFSYYASTVQDRHDLGAKHWVGQLDQPAFRAMRSGGRILDAVKDTVTSINGQLARAIKAEKQPAASHEKPR